MYRESTELLLTDNISCPSNFEGRQVQSATVVDGIEILQKVALHLIGKRLGGDDPADHLRCCAQRLCRQLRMNRSRRVLPSAQFACSCSSSEFHLAQVNFLYHEPVMTHRVYAIGVSFCHCRGQNHGSCFRTRYSAE